LLLEFGERIEDIFSPIAESGLPGSSFFSQGRSLRFRMSHSKSFDNLPTDERNLTQNQSKSTSHTGNNSSNSRLQVKTKTARRRLNHHVSQLARFIIYLSCIRAVMDGYLPYSYEKEPLATAVVLD
jgi:hypothetical protein